MHRAREPSRNVHRSRALALAALALTLGSAAFPLQGQSAPNDETVAPRPLAALVLNPGDALRITVWRNPELSGEFEVGADGSIRHPLYRQVQVGGVPLSEAETRVRAFLERLEVNPQFILEPLFRVSITGEVRQPGLYTLAPETTLAHAIARAGGPTERGRTDRVQVRRQGAEVVLDLARLEGAAQTEFIRAGDQIFVARRQAIFRDYVAPTASIAGAMAAVINMLLRNR